MAKTPPLPGLVKADGIPVHCAHTKIVPTASLKPHPRNPNRHPQKQIEIFGKVIQQLGWRMPIVVSTRCGLVIKGHGKLLVAKHLGLKEVPIDEQPYRTTQEEWQDLIADNRIAELSERDDDEIKSLLVQLQADGADPELTGYDTKAIARMIDTLSGPAGEPEDLLDQAEVLQEKWKVKTGDTWKLGDHLVTCGDAKDPAVWGRLMGQETAQLVHTDPPYGVDYQDAQGRTLKGDEFKRDALVALIRESMRCAVRHTTPTAAFYVWHASVTRRDFEFALHAVGLIEKQYITWVKDHFTLGRADYHWQTEPCFYAEKAGHTAMWVGDRTLGTVWRIRSIPNDGSAVALGNGLLLTDGEKASMFLQAHKPAGKKARHIRVTPEQPAIIADRSQTTAWEVSRDKRGEYLHPTQKPVELAAIPVCNSAREGDIVVDCFLGGAATLLACERHGRICRGIDMDPKFVSVALSAGTAKPTAPLHFCDVDTHLWALKRHLGAADAQLPPTGDHQ